MSSPVKSPPSDMASPVRKPGHPCQLIWYQIVFLLRLCLIFVVAFFLLAVLNVVILNARQPIHCPNASQPPALTTADGATSTWIPTFPDETSRDMFYRTANLTTFLEEEDVRGVVLLLESLEILSGNDSMLAVEQAITTIEQLSDDAGSDPDLPVDLIDAWYGLGTDACILFSHLVTLHDAGFYAMRSFALQLRHIDLALDKLWKSWTPWDYVKLHMQMKTSCGILKRQLALLNEELDKIYAVVESSRIDAAGIEKVIQDMHRTLILSFDEGQELESLWNTPDNLTFVNEDFMGVVDPRPNVHREANSV
ncbi:hypothetical protein EV421DRAFT_1905559 [Armillaria borealis]|uniref:Uncharacterized protein n=1 Tax=Armillaria borealis TaxID=47425 RepID=A0AA39MNN7_9AGAR|nr:hypothetical protein EV421DRAFT_1905559 [Armillaria borealis]